MVDNAKSQIAVLVSGRGSNLQAIIDSIEQGNLCAEIALVLSNKQSAPALERAEKRGIPIRFIDPRKFSSREEFDREMIRVLKSTAVDLICLAGFMRILSREFIQAFDRKIINIHPSLLPAFPGLNAQQQALDYGVKISGCTVHFVDVEVDAGPVILQATVPVVDSDTEDTLSNKILEQEHIIYPRAIKMFLENRLGFSGNKVQLKSD